MIYHSEHLKLRSVMDVFRGNVNDVMICEDFSEKSGNYYTLVAVHDHEVVKKLLRIIKESGKSMDCCLDMFSYGNSFCMVFPYVKERRLEDFYMVGTLPLSTCEEICMNLLLQCMASTLPYPLLELVLKQKQMHLLRDNSIVLGYCIDLSEINENCGEKECTLQCATRIRELLEEKITKKNVSLQLLMKKIPKQSYHDFRELYKDICLTKTKSGKKSLKKSAKAFGERNQSVLFRIVLYLSVIMAITVLIMLLSNIVWGDIPFLRMLTNTFKQIGTETLGK